MLKSQEIQLDDPKYKGRKVSRKDVFGDEDINDSEAEHSDDAQSDCGSETVTPSYLTTMNDEDDESDDTVDSDNDDSEDEQEDAPEESDQEV
jgi:protein AATF/BFR2